MIQKIIPWALLAILGPISLSCVLGNYRLIWRNIIAKSGEKIPSLMPFVGGAAGFIAVKIFFALKLGPPHSPSWYAWLPAALDPGCYLVYLLVMPIVWTLRGYRR